MIPDFKTFIGESLFGNMSDKGRGEVVKKEDDVNTLDLKELGEYIKEKYNKRGHLVSTSSLGALSVTIAVDYNTEFRPTNIKISLFWYKGEKKLFIYGSDSVIEELSKEFGLNRTSNNYELEQEGEELTNSIIISVIDRLLDICSRKRNIEILLDYDEKPIYESLFGSMSDKGRGEVVKKEDNINLLDRDDFYKYIMKHYKTATEDVTGPYSIINSKNSDYINIPILEDGINTLYRVIIWNFDKDTRYITIQMKEPFLGSKLFVKMRDTFELKGLDNQYNPLFKVFPKDNKKVDNKFFLEVIDFIIDNAEEPFEPLLTRI